jgi:hypothetical protein
LIHDFKLPPVPSFLIKTPSDRFVLHCHRTFSLPDIASSTAEMGPALLWSGAGVRLPRAYAQTIEGAIVATPGTVPAGMSTARRMYTVPLNLT